MNEINKPLGQVQAAKSAKNTVDIGNEPVLQVALDLLGLFGDNDCIILRSKGNYIPNAVAIANIIMEMRKKKTLIKNITLDTDQAPGIGKMTSTIEIILAGV